MSDQKDQELMPIILWGAMLMSHLIFIFIFYSVIKVDPDKEFDPNLLLIFGGLALTSGFISLFFKTRSYSAKDIQQFFAPFIVSMALAESVHIYGLVARTIGMSMDYYFGFAVAGILLHLNCFPRLGQI